MSQFQLGNNRDFDLNRQNNRSAKKTIKDNYPQSMLIGYAGNRRVATRALMRKITVKVYGITISNSASRN